MTTLERLLLAWKTTEGIPAELTKGQLEEIKDSLPGDTEPKLLTALDSAIAERATRAA